MIWTQTFLPLPMTHHTYRLPLCLWPTSHGPQVIPKLKSYNWVPLSMSFYPSWNLYLCLFSVYSRFGQSQLHFVSYYILVPRSQKLTWTRQRYHGDGYSQPSQLSSLFLRLAQNHELKLPRYNHLPVFLSSHASF